MGMGLGKVGGLGSSVWVEMRVNWAVEGRMVVEDELRSVSGGFSKR